MSGILKFAGGVAVLGFVGLVGLSVLGIVTALVVGRAESHQVVPGVEVPARVENVDITYPMTGYAGAHTVKDDSGIHIIFQAVFFTTIALVLASAFIIVLRLTRGKHVSATPDETALVHELARRAQDLAQRMEALETILLDRTRAAR